MLGKHPEWGVASQRKPFLRCREGRLFSLSASSSELGLLPLQRKPPTVSMAFFVAGTGFIASRCLAMGQRKKQPKETSIALQSKFLFCSQEDASIT